jgi:CheY-like chemotaxis protein
MTARTGKTPIAVTILMVEDDEGHARLIEKNIRRAGVNNDVVQVDTGAKAFGYLFDDAHRRQPVLVLLDLNLPDMSGIDILARIKADDRTRRIPVIILTTTDDKREMQRCYDLGCNVYITKPVAYESFAGAIKQLGLFLSVMQVPESP